MKKLIKIGSLNGYLNEKQIEILSTLNSAKIKSKKYRNQIEDFISLRGIKSIEDQELVLTNRQLAREFYAIKNTPKIKRNEVFIYCDGSRKNNGHSGSGVVIQTNRGYKMFYGDFLSNSTNNVAELNALYKAMQLATKVRNKVTIYSDSQYAIKSITLWSKGWRKNGWVRPLKNNKLIREISTFYFNNSNKIHIQWVKAHVGIEGNELADRMANMAVTKKQVTYKECKLNINKVLKG